MAKLSGITTPSLTFDEGAAPSTPAANKVILYAKSDGLLYSKDDAGAESAVSGTGGGGGTAYASRAIRTTTQSISTGTTTAIAFDSETAPGGDTNAIHSTVSNTSRFTVPTGGAGWWFGTGGGGWDTNTSGVRYMWWRLNGTTDIPGSADLRGAPHSYGQNQQASFGPMLLADGDYLELVVNQDSGGSRTIGAGSLGVGSCAASVARLGS